MSIQRLCYFLFIYFFGGVGGGGGVGSITEALPGVGVQGEKSIHLRVTEEQRAQLILRRRGTLGNREIWGTREKVPSSLPGRASSVVCNDVASDVGVNFKNVGVLSIESSLFHLFHYTFLQTKHQRKGY